MATCFKWWGLVLKSKAVKTIIFIKNSSPYIGRLIEIWDKGEYIICFWEIIYMEVGI